LLEYFGELFSSSECKRIMSTEFSDLNQTNSTLSYIIDILRGIK
ncbi:unnamed protein product, partial [Rotaria sordida]